jgi:hypothetical protein
VILFIPGPSASIPAEVGLLTASNLWYKMLVLMPPRPKNLQNDDESYAMGDRSCEMRRTMLQDGYSLPDYQETGRKEDLSVNLAWPLALWNFGPKHLPEALDGFIKPRRLRRLEIW